MPLSNEEKRNLKEGEIYIDEETQKKYRVKKAAFPQHQIGGPHGLGEPDDRSLRKVEADVLIPKLMNEAVEKIECHDLHLAIVNCFRLHGGVKGLKACAPERDIYNVCKIEK
uniref:COX assembly mitochondrial protein n=1 Tax=Plectus sambesii TaxID=2011161 RepID=A0A914UX83_9BILA